MSKAKSGFDRDAVLRGTVLSEVARALRLEIDDSKSTPRKGDWFARCPFHAENTASFHMLDGPGFFKCFGCGAKGTAIDLVMGLENLEFPDALARLATMAGVTPDTERVQRRPSPPPANDGPRRAIFARDIWARARPDPGVALYLEARAPGLSQALGDVPPSLRLVRSAWNLHHQPPLILPVMVAPIQRFGLKGVQGVHRTFLAPDCRGKYEPPSGDKAAVKRMLGPCWGGAVRLGAMSKRLAIAEGIETALAWAALRDPAEPEITVWAAGSRGNQCRGIEVPPGLSEIVLIGDNDSTSKGEIEAELSAGCKRLAGQASIVRRDMPPRGFDFLDLFRMMAQ